MNKDFKRILHKHGLSDMYTDILQRWLLDELNYNDRPRVNIFNKLTNFFIYRGNK